MHECVHTQSSSQIMHAFRKKINKKKNPEHFRTVREKRCRMHSFVIFTSASMNTRCETMKSLADSKIKINILV